MTRHEVRGTSRVAPPVNRTVIRLVTALLGLAAFAAAAAAADGPGVSATTNSLFASGGRMYTTAVHPGRTTLSLWRAGAKAKRTRLDGNLGFPIPTFDGTGEGISHDGRTLLLASRSRFVAVDARSLAVRRNVRLRGQFSYDALSPNGRMLFLIQHASPTSQRYYVRAYDLRQGRLLSQIIFDTREKGEGPMSGTPVTRATGPSGRWIYTLYVRPSGTMFVHALDSVDLHAYCVDLPPRVTAANVWRTKLELKPGRLAVARGTKRLAVIDTRTLRVRA
jgi:hypothetical protein